MGSTQDLYAANLLQHCGYPLYSPGPGRELEELYQTEGTQIGDVGYVNGEGEFNPLFNLCSPLPDKLRDRGFPEHESIDIGEPYSKPCALEPGHIFFTGVKRTLETSSSDVSYEFIADSHEGAVLILPSGATLVEVPYRLETFREAASKYALLWCERSRFDTLFLITGMYKARNFTLAAFSDGHHGGKMLVKCDARTVRWESQFAMYSRSSPPGNELENQTILIKGFRVKAKWGLLPVVERVTYTPLPIKRYIASYIAIFYALLQALFQMANVWPRQTVEYVPPLTRLHHPSDTINRYLLDKV